MARLTNHVYLLQHHQLKKEWSSSGGGAFVMLSPTEQWTLHAYYEFTKSLSDAELITHRRRISQSQPSLPHRAGKAVAKLAVFTDRLEAYRARPRVRTRKKGAPYEVRIFSEVNMNIDPVEFARILIQAAKERSDQD